MSRTRSPVQILLGCLLAPVFFGAPIAAIVAGSLWVMSAEYSATEAATALGLHQGPRYGFDGWYVGRWRGRDVALAAVFHGGGQARIRQKNIPYVEVAMVGDGPRLGGTAVWANGRFEGVELPDDLERRATAFAEAHGTLLLADGGTAPWPFEHGLVVVNSYQAAGPEAEDVEARLQALVEVLSGP